MIHDSLKPYEDRKALGLIRRVDNGPLTLYNYTDKCTYDRAWDEYTMRARGIIFERETGKLVALPFGKFFNLGEHESTALPKIPANERYNIWEKMDGSLGIVYHYEGKWNVATRGSFTSPQAIEGQKILQEKYDTRIFLESNTYLVEIIYPENKIIVDYGSARRLVLLGSRSRVLQDFYANYNYLEMMSRGSGMPLCQRRFMSIAECVMLQKCLPKNEEGFVVEFDSGFRVKIKGDEYLKAAKIMSNMTPLAFYEVMTANGKVDTKYLMSIPEEYRPIWEPMVKALEKKYDEVYRAALIEFERLNMTDPREIGIALKDFPHRFKYGQMFFPILKRQYDRLHKMIMAEIRPTGNIL